MQRPPWHHALVQLVGQHIAGVVSEVNNFSFNIFYMNTSN